MSAAQPTTSNVDNHVWWFEVMGCESESDSCYLEWQLIHICALIPATLSIFASIYIITTGIYYHQHLKTINLSFGAKIPIFISICDLTFELSHGGDHLHNLITGYVSEGALCQLFGSLKPLSINCQTAWALGAAWYLISVFKRKNTNYDKFESKCIYLHILCWGIPTVILIFGFIYNVYGVEGPWCGVPDPLTDLLMVDLWMITTYFLLFIGYSYTGYRLYKIMKGYFEPDSIGRSGIERAIKTFGLFPLAYLIQWLPYALFKTDIVPHTFGIIIWVVMTSNLGGIFNLLLYHPLLINQVKSSKYLNEQKMIRKNNNWRVSRKKSKSNLTKQFGYLERQSSNAIETNNNTNNNNNNNKNNDENENGNAYDNDQCDNNKVVYCTITDIDTGLTIQDNVTITIDNSDNTNTNTNSNCGTDNNNDNNSTETANDIEIQVTMQHQT